MAISPHRTIPVLGEPSAELPGPAGAVRSPEAAFILHPPVDSEIAYRVPRYVLFLAYSSATADMGVGEAPMRRTRIRAGSAMLVEPGTCVRVRQHEPVEFLVLAVEAAHVRAVGDRATGRPPGASGTPAPWSTCSTRASPPWRPRCGARCSSIRWSSRPTCRRSRTRS
jgi:hypothetical protein